MISKVVFIGGISLFFLAFYACNYVVLPFQITVKLTSEINEYIDTY